ncbi:LSU ribosomal protein L10P [Chishuiella changwenlii]|uniref:Large ribosomal subunit protein uL10 n=2 Tax=Chishuiella changwenlii TaxID=1434701 RepID=A0A1M6SMC4_9FLAO|nr:50S ribosomal protein L10 [Chishuiella changwenlii]SHK45872.1 LSU ribosomal protein L10P [Chishuiella changwenlii]
MAMTKQDKANMIDELQAVLADSKIIYLADIDGLNAVNTTELRRACYKSNVTLRVVKNTLLKKAMEQIEDKNFEELYGSLKGNTALMTAEVGNAPAKVIETFRKKSEKPILKGAWIEDNTWVGDDKLPQLVALKSREELIADIIMLLQSPIKTVVSQLENKENAAKEEGASEE